MHGSEPVGDTVHPASEPKRLRLEDLRPLVIRSLEQLQNIIDRYNSLQVPKDDAPFFVEHLTQRRDAWFVEAGDVGLVYLTQVLPGFSATLHVVFWDGHLTQDRREAVKSVLRTGMKLFELQRVSAAAAETNLPVRQMLKKVGFALEGVIRRSWLGPDGLIDTFLFGILKEELPPCLELSTTSSAVGTSGTTHTPNSVQRALLN